MKSIKSTFIVALLAGCSTTVFGQDTIKVGINEQIIQVTAPEKNQKISIMIEDSAANYKVDITRYTGLPEKKEKQSLAGMTRRQIRKMNKDWHSTIFGEAEFGYRTLIGKQVARSSALGILFDTSFLEPTDTFFRGPVGDYSTVGFESEGDYNGVYLDLTIREKTRSLWGTDRVYLSNGTHLGFNYNSARGSMVFRDSYGFEDFRVDSVVSEEKVRARLSEFNFQVSKRFNIGYYLNEAKDFSIEYGVDIGMRIVLRRMEALEDNRTYLVEGGLTPFFGNRPNHMSSPFVTFNHRLGINYKRVSLNAGVSYGDFVLGDYSEKNTYGKRMTLGLAYRW